MRKRILFASSPEGAAIADRIDDLVAGEDFRLKKATPRTTAGFLRYGGSHLFVKRTTAGSWLTSIADAVRGSRASRALHGSAILDRAGFAHPRPVAAVEFRSFGLVRASYLISEALADACILSLFALTDGRNFQRRKWVSQEVAREIQRLHEAGIYTRDMQETNLMLAASGDEIIVYFVDLEDFRRTRHVSARRRMLNLVHLDRSIGRFVSRSQRLRFFYNYLGGKPEPARARGLLARLSRIRNHADKSKNDLTAANTETAGATRGKLSGAGTAHD
jgi:tRNA A-37 threonylcarbamoyl transferase component Bud32